MSRSDGEALAAAIREARRPVVFTGSGISAESGVPTFRDAQTGLWARFRAEDLATPEAFERDPQLVWDWYRWRRELVARAAPNAGHRALAEWQRRVGELVLITQNVDGLHQEAGSTGVIELHGSVLRSRCMSGHRDLDEPEEQEGLPRCPRCGAVVRPDVVWFGEELPLAAFEAAVAAVRQADLFLSVGTSTLVQPAASLPFEALRRGVPVVEVNPQRTPLSDHAPFLVRSPAGEALPALLAAAWPEGES